MYTSLEIDVGTMMMMMIVFVEWLTKEWHLCIISSRNHCQRFSPLQIFDMPLAGLEYALP